ncbi:MAG TPA: type 1 glutamine amidotransferase [Nitrosospira sp.]|nr:type 1 glutamine amidotransferase [Nitrosospira sp.]
MKPVAIFRHFPTEGPGYLATFLDSHSIPWQLIKIDSGGWVPSTPDAFGGLVFMGGPMSVNDDLPWIPPVLSLIRHAVEDGIPVLGHCLGGQLMSKALGGVVEPSPIKEIGWGEVYLADNPVAPRWVGGKAIFEVFHWHGETFTLPEGSTLLFSSPYCQNQAFALDNHLGLQCHVEMTEEMVITWCKTGAREIAASAGPGVEPVAAIQMRLVERVSALNKIADKLYEKWILGLKSEA